MMGFWVGSMKILTHFSTNLSLYRARMHVILINVSFKQFLLWNIVHKSVTQTLCDEPVL